MLLLLAFLINKRKNVYLTLKFIYENAILSQFPIYYILLTGHKNLADDLERFCNAMRKKKANRHK